MSCTGSSYLLGYAPLSVRITASLRSTPHLLPRRFPLSLFTRPDTVRRHDFGSTLAVVPAEQMLPSRRSSAALEPFAKKNLLLYYA
jgi:hypothetical protein